MYEPATMSGLSQLPSQQYSILYMYMYVRSRTWHLGRNNISIAQCMFGKETITPTHWWSTVEAITIRVEVLNALYVRNREIF